MKHTAEYLKHFNPWLRNEFRAITKKELKKESVFLELFPNEEIDLNKLLILYKYQNELQK